MRNNFEIAGAEGAIFNSLNLLENEIVKIKINQSSTLRSLLNKPTRFTILRKFSTLLALIRVLLA
jgi:hypothetical protein